MANLRMLTRFGRAPAIEIVSDLPEVFVHVPEVQALAGLGKAKVKG